MLLTLRVLNFPYTNLRMWYISSMRSGISPGVMIQSWHYGNILGCFYGLFLTSGAEGKKVEQFVYLRKGGLLLRSMP